MKIIHKQEFSDEILVRDDYVISDDRFTLTLSKEKFKELLQCIKDYDNE